MESKKYPYFAAIVCIICFNFSIAFGQSNLSANVVPLVVDIFSTCGQLNPGTPESAQAHQLCIQRRAELRRFGSKIPATSKEIGAVCGKGPGQFHTVCIQNFSVRDADAAVATSTVTATSPVVADGVSISTVTVQLRDAQGNDLDKSGGTVVVAATGSAQASVVTDNGDGTYSATLTNRVAETVKVSATLNNAAITDTANVVFTSGDAAVATSTVTATSPVVADGVSISTVTVQLRDAQGNDLDKSGGTVVVAATGSAQASVVTDNGDGTYSATLTNRVAETVKVSATLNNAAITDTANVVFTSGDAAVATSTVTATSPVVADGVSISTVTVQLRDAQGNDLDKSGGTVVVAATGSAQASVVTDNGDGTYSATLTNRVAETVKVSATLNNAAITDTANVVFTSGDAAVATSTVTATSPVVADGVSISTVTVQLRDAQGNDLDKSGGTVVVAATGSAQASVVTDNGDGTYSATLTNRVAETVKVSATLNNAAITDTANVVFTSGDAAVATSTVTATSPVVADGVSISTVTVQLRDAQGNDLDKSGGTVVVAATGSAQASVVTDNGDGTYSATLTNRVAETVKVSATLNNAAITDTANVVFTSGDAAVATSTVTATSPVVADGVSISTVTVQLRDAQGNDLDKSGGTVVVAATGSAQASVVTDNGDGTYSATLTNRVAETVKVSATLNNAAITDTANVVFTSGDAAVATSTVTATSPVVADGVSISTVTVQLRDAQGNDLDKSGGTVVVAATGSAQASVVTDNGDGTYSATLTNRVAETVKVSATLNNAAITDTANVVFTSGDAAVATSTVTATSPVVADGVSISTVTVQLRDAQGNDLDKSGGTVVVAATGSAQASVVTDNGDGTYSATLTNRVAETVKVSATLNNAAITDTANVVFTSGDAAVATSTVTATSPVVADGVSISTVTVQLRDAQGNDLDKSGGTVVVAATGSAQASVVTDNGDGTYSATLTNRVAETVKVSATLNNAAITDTANVVFTSGDAAVATSTVTATSPVVADGVSISTVTVQLRDAQGNDLDKSGGTVVVAATGSAQASVVTDNGDGTYSATLTNRVAETVKVSATLNNAAITDTANVVFTSGDAAVATSTVTATSPVVADGVSISTVTVQLRDAQGNDLDKSGGTVVVAATGSAQASVVTDNGDGTYSATLTNRVAETVKVSATLNNAAITDTANVVFTSGDAAVATSTVTATSPVVADGVSISTVTVQLRDAQGNDLDKSGGTVVVAATGSAQASVVTDNGDGTYSATLTNRVAETVKVSATLNNAAITDTANVVFTSGDAAVATSTVTATSPVVADGVSISTVTVQLRDAQGNDLDKSGGTVVVAATGSAQASVVTDNGDGTYSATLTNRVAETVKVSATLNNAAITDTANVVFTSGDAAVATSTVTATSPVVADGVSISTVTVQLRDAQGNDLDKSGGTVVVAATGSAQASVVTDNGDGTYSATLTNRVAETVKVSATLNNAAITDTANVVFTSGDAAVATSTVTATSPVVADGVSISTVTVQLRDAQGNDLDKSGGTVVVAATGSAQASVVTDNGDGTYSATLTNRVAETVKVSATLNNAAITDTANVVFTSGDAAVATSTVTATSPVVADGVSISTVTVQLRDAQGNDLDKSGGTVVVAATGSAQASVVTDNGDGTYSATLTNRVAETVKVSATLNNAAITDTANVVFTSGDAAVATSTVTATSPVVADGVSISTVTVQLRDAQGNDLDKSGGTVVVAATGSAQASVVTDNGDGTYSATLTNRVAETVKVSATLNNAAITDTANVVFTSGDAAVATSTVTATSPVVADGVSISTVTVQLRDAQGNDLDKSGGTVVVAATGSAQASVVTDNGDGTYSATLTNRVAETVKVSATLNNAAITDTANVVFTSGDAAVATSTVTATSPVVADGVSISTVTVQLRDAQGNDLDKSGGTVVVAATGSAQASVVTDNGDGTYSATLTNRVAETVKVSATLNNAAITDTANVVFTSGDAAVATSTVTATSPVVADGVSISTVTVQLRDAQGNDLDKSGGTVVVAATGSAQASVVTDNGDGTYSATLTNRVAETVKVSATLNNAAITDTANVVFTSGDAAVATSTVTATSPVVADGVSISTVTVQLRDAQGNDLDKSGGTVVVAATGSAQASVVTDNGDGTYSATLTNRVAETVKVSATLNNAAITDTANVVFTSGDAGTVIIVIESLEEAGMVRFQSTTEVLNVAVLVASGTSRSDEISVPVGQHKVDYILPTGFSVTNISCLPDNNIDRRKRRISLSVKPGTAITCMLSIEDAASRTAEEIANFLEERAWLIMSNRSDRHRRIARLKDERLGASLKIKGHKSTRSIKSPLSLDMDATEDLEEMQFRFSCTQGTSGNVCGSNDWWMEGHVGRYTRGEAKGTYAVTHAGVDRRFGEDVLVGLAVQYDRVVREGKGDRPGAKFRSDGWMAGPYMTWRLYDRLYFDAGISVGTATNRIAMTDGGASGTFNSQRFSGYATLVGDLDRGNWNIRPQFSLSWYEETARSWIGTDVDGHGIPIPEVQVRTGGLESGVRFTRKMEDGVSSQYFEIEGVLALAGNTDNESRLRLRTGLMAAMPFGGVLDAGISFDGLGHENWQAYGLKLGYSVAPHWLPGTVDAGLSFNGSGAEDFDFKGLTLDFRLDPDPWLGGILTMKLSVEDAEDETYISSAREGFKSIRLYYEAKF